MLELGEKVGLKKLKDYFTLIWGVHYLLRLILIYFLIYINGVF